MKYSLNLTYRLILFAGFIWISSCTREEANPNSSRIQIKMPDEKSISQKSKIKGLSLPTSLKYCFAINVQGPGIESKQSNSCAPTTGIIAGSVSANDTVTIDVPKGSSRSFTLYAFLAQVDETCPEFTDTFFSSPVSRMRTYVSLIKSGIELKADVETVSLEYSLPSTDQSIGALGSSVCLPTPSLRGFLNSTGDVYENLQFNSELSSPLANSYFSIDINTSYKSGTSTALGVIRNGKDNEFEVPPWLNSITRKPDLGIFYGLDIENQIYELRKDTDGSAIAVALDSTNCPFDVQNCKLPAWIQSMSAGYGKQVFGMDIQGQIYSLSDSTATGLSIFVDPTAIQISFY